MKFFTPNAYRSYYGPASGHLEDTGALATAEVRYRQHLASLRGQLPASVLELAELPGLDDALLVEAHHLRSLQTLVLILRCGYLQMGYYDLVLTYEDAELSPRDEWTLAWIARATKSDREHADLFAHEVDRTETGKIEHRFLFHPGRWFAIRCRSLRWEKRERPDRTLPRLADRFPGGPTHPPRRDGGGRIKAEPPRR